MADAFLLCAAFACAASGMAFCALAMKVHWQQVRGGAPGPSAVRRLRLRAVAALVGSFALCVLADHISMAVLVWVMMLTVSSVLCALVLAYRPQSLRFLLVFVG